MEFLIADDHALFRSGCRLLLEQLEPDSVIHETADFDGALRIVEDRPDLDLILLDLVMPGVGSVGDIRRLRAAAPDTSLVIMSAYERPADARKALNLGASGYIPKSASKEVILRALQLVLSGGSYFPPNLLKGEVEGPDWPGLREVGEDVGSDALKTRLTQRQRDVLDRMAMGRSNREIAEELGLAEGTVKVHVAAVLKALGVSNRTQAVLAAARLKR